MTLDEICEGLEKSKELAKAGFPQGKSCFVWIFDDSPPPNWTPGRWTLVKNHATPCDHFAAPTLAEILGELPITFQYDKDNFHLEIFIPDNEVLVKYKPFAARWAYTICKLLSPADLYIRLAKEGLIPEKGKE